LPGARIPVPGYNAIQKLNGEPRALLIERNVTRRRSYGSTAWLDIRIRQPQRQPALISDDLLERLAEIELEIVPFRSWLPPVTGSRP
jgi:hypothetical protein